MEALGTAIILDLTMNEGGMLLRTPSSITLVKKKKSHYLLAFMMGYSTRMDELLSIPGEELLILP